MWVLRQILGSSRPGLSSLLQNSFVIMSSHQWSLRALYRQFAFPLHSHCVSCSLSFNCNFTVLWYAFLISCSAALVGVSIVFECSMKSQRCFLTLVMNAEISGKKACSSLLYRIHSGGSAVRLATPRANAPPWSRRPAPGGSFEHSLGMMYLEITY